jgi:hypothetical protein
MPQMLPNGRMAKARVLICRNASMKVRLACKDLQGSHHNVNPAQPIGFLGRNEHGQMQENRPIKCAGEEGS